jgi:hypothetical protein
MLPPHEAEKTRTGALHPAFQNAKRNAPVQYSLFDILLFDILFEH